MATPLLETKLFVPRPRRGLVARPRLSERLGRGTESKLTLVSAPPGFGKTTLLAAWLAATATSERATAWLSLDPGDNQASSFWPYLVAALETVAPGVGANALALLQESQPPPIEAVLATLLNDLAAIPIDIVLVLDDYHVVDGRDIADGMAYLVDHLPSRLHLVITTRADPALPLARLRARGELVEIRSADLRFTPEEAAGYLNGVMGLDLTGSDVAALEGRTEGWIAALQLAALSLQGREDTASFIARFAGDDRYIVDYLVEEVLQRQPDAVRSFLLQTSILDRLSGPLCDAVTGQEGGRARLEALVRGNLFLAPLDDRRRFYRYHQLFADVLRAHLFDEQPATVPDLHRRASAWFEDNGERFEAIRHALAAEDFARVADLAELALPDMRIHRQSATLLPWLDAVPTDIVQRRPVLTVAYAWALMEARRIEDATAQLQTAERWLEAPPEVAPGMVVLNEVEFAGLPATIALYRAALAVVQGDVAATLHYAQRVLELVPDDELLRRGSATSLMGLAYWTRGDLESAHRMFAEGMAGVQQAGLISDAISGAVTLADFRVAQGRLRDAARTYAQALDLAEAQGEPAPRGTADLYVGLSELARERDDMESATRHLLTSQALGERTGFRPNGYRWHVAMARIREARGDPVGALDLVTQAERLYVRNQYFPDVRPVGAEKARLWAAQGSISEALDWARERGLTAQDDVSYVREFEHITLARVLLAQCRRDRVDSTIPEVTALLERLLEAAEGGARTGTEIEVLVLQALGQQLEGNIAAALEPLGRALALAEPEGYVRIFVDEGPSMVVLLEAAAKRGIAPSYVRRLLTALGRAEDRTPANQVLIEPLSERELDVLRLLATDLDGPDIANELVVSLHTVRSHTKSIYAKLGVNNRRAAVRLAVELDLLTRARH